MRTGPELKELFERRIFVKPPASDITIHKIEASAQTLKGYYGYSKNTTSTLVTIGVPYGVVSGSRQYQVFGVTNDGRNRIAVPADTNVKVGDSIIIEGLPHTNEVTDVTNLQFHNINCGLIVTTKVRL